MIKGKGLERILGPRLTPFYANKMAENSENPTVPWLKNKRGVTESTVVLGRYYATLHT